AVKVKPTIDANIAQAMANISSVARALAALNGRVAKTYLQNFVQDVVIPRGGGRIGTQTGGIAGRDMRPPGPTDTLSYWLSPGEGVLTTRAVARIGGPAAVDAINAGRATPAHAVAVSGGGAAARGGG